MKTFFNKLQLKHHLIGLAVLYLLSFIIPIYKTTFMRHTTYFRIFDIELIVSCSILVILVGLVVLLFRKSLNFYNIILLSLITIMNFVLFVYIQSNIFNYRNEDIVDFELSFGIVFYAIVFVWNTILFVYTMYKKETREILRNELKMKKRILYSLEIILIITLLFYVFFFKLTPTEELAFNTYEKISQDYPAGEITQLRLSYNPFIEINNLDNENTCVGPKFLLMKVDNKNYIINIKDGSFIKGNENCNVENGDINLNKIKLRIALNNWFKK